MAPGLPLVFAFIILLIFSLMKLTHSLLLALATAALASCSAEPSDWRPDQKVSLDLVEPGTRTTENFEEGHSVSLADDIKAQEKSAEKAETKVRVEVPGDASQSANSVEAMEKRGATMQAVEEGNTPAARKAETGK